VINADTGEYIAFLRSREYDNLIPFLRTFDGVETVSRDGSQTYARAITTALPNAQHVSDRFHLLKNLTEAASNLFAKIVPFCIVPKRSKENILGISGKKTAVERGIIDNYKKKLKLFNQVKALQAQGKIPTVVSRETGVNISMVRQYFKMDELPLRSSIMMERDSKLNAYKGQILQMITDGVRGIDIVATIRKAGFTGTDSLAKMYISRVRRDGVDNTLAKFYRRDICRLLYSPIEKIHDETLRAKIAGYLAARPDVETIIALVNNFRAVLKSGAADALDEWRTTVKHLNIRELNSFVKHLDGDLQAIKNAILYPYSNGIAEGKINKIKTIKRQTYGRASYEILTARLFLSDVFG
jgi:transposase